MSWNNKEENVKKFVTINCDEICALWDLTQRRSRNVGTEITLLAA